MSEDERTIEREKNIGSNENDNSVDEYEVNENPDESVPNEVVQQLKEDEVVQQLKDKHIVIPRIRIVRKISAFQIPLYLLGIIIGVVGVMNEVNITEYATSVNLVAIGAFLLAIGAAFRGIALFLEDRWWKL